MSRFVAVCLCGVGLVRGADTKPGGPWQSLFNGNNLSGWVPMNDAVFFATNGCIHLAKSSGWLRTERQFTNFVFEAEWRALHSNYNSGFFLRAGLTGKPFPTEVWQVNLKESALGSLLKGSLSTATSVSRRKAAPSIFANCAWSRHLSIIPT